jgi:hypothetical protein
MAKKRVYERAYASVRFIGDSLDPLTVTLALRIPADHTHRHGEPHLVRTHKGVVTEYSPYSHGMWSMSSESRVHSPRLAVHLEWLIAQLEPKKDAIASLLRGGIHANFFCYSAGSTSVPPSLPRVLRTRAESLNIEILIDHYDIRTAK